MLHSLSVHFTLSINEKDRLSYTPPNTVRSDLYGILYSVLQKLSQRLHTKSCSGWDSRSYLHFLKKKRHLASQTFPKLKYG